MSVVGKNKPSPHTPQKLNHPNSQVAQQEITLAALWCLFGLVSCLFPLKLETFSLVKPELVGTHQLLSKTAVVSIVV